MQLKLRRSVNFLYYCDAVKHIDIDTKGHYQFIWQISLHAGNDPRWLISHHKYLFSGILQAWKKTGFSSPESIIVNAPAFDVVVPIKI